MSLYMPLSPWLTENINLGTDTCQLLMSVLEGMENSETVNKSTYFSSPCSSFSSSRNIQHIEHNSSIPYQPQQQIHSWFYFPILPLPFALPVLSYCSSFFDSPLSLPPSVLPFLSHSLSPCMRFLFILSSLRDDWNFSSGWEGHFSVLLFPCSFYFHFLPSFLMFCTGFFGIAPRSVSQGRAALSWDLVTLFLTHTFSSPHAASSCRMQDTLHSSKDGA